MKYWVVDAFTNEPFKGNPAAVIVVDKFPSDMLMQLIAGEINLSETAFIVSSGNNNYNIRWFTPLKEVNLCGHATLAASYVLWSENIEKNNHIVFDSKSGILRTSQKDGWITLDFPRVDVKEIVDKSEMENNLGINTVFVGTAGEDYLVELSSGEELTTLKPNFRCLEGMRCRGLVVTSQAEKQYDFISRFFAPKYGINEDSVTGSAHCALAPYWSKKLNKKQLFAYQASTRGGELKLQINDNRVLIGGQAVGVMQGYINLPEK